MHIQLVIFLSWKMHSSILNCFIYFSVNTAWDSSFLENRSLRVSLVKAKNIVFFAVPCKPSGVYGSVRKERNLLSHEQTVNNSNIMSYIKFTEATPFDNTKKLVYLSSTIRFQNITKQHACNLWGNALYPINCV